jgi:hypothetical protein
MAGRFLEEAAAHQGTLDRYSDHDTVDCSECNGPHEGRIHGARVDADVAQIEALMLFARAVAGAVVIATDPIRLSLVCSEVERESMAILKRLREGKE